MRLYKVPLHTQIEGSEDCGPVASTMVLDYFGVTSDQEEVIKKVPRCSYGTSAFDNANTLLDYGLDVTIITANPLLFDGDFLRSKPPQPRMKTRINEVFDEERSGDKKSILEGLLKFMNLGGIVKAEIPTEKHITEAIKQQKLVIALIYGRVLGEHDGPYHFVVISGYDKSRLFISNPLKESKRQAWHKTQDVLFSIHANTTYDYDNGSLLVVSKQ